MKLSSSFILLTFVASIMMTVADIRGMAGGASSATTPLEEPEEAGELNQSHLATDEGAMAPIGEDDSAVTNNFMQEGQSVAEDGRRSLRRKYYKRRGKGGYVVRVQSKPKIVVKSKPKYGGYYSKDIFVVKRKGNGGKGKGGKGKGGKGKGM